MILGSVCTRDCRFCGVRHGRPAGVRSEEPQEVARAVGRMGIDYAVVTSVTRDDLSDGGAAHFAATIRAIRSHNPGCRVEVLTPDFAGSPEAIEAVGDASPEVYGHNVETVPRLYPHVRPGAQFNRSIRLLEKAKSAHRGVLTKSGLMLGLGEKRSEVTDTLRRLLDVGCDIVTMGQYLQPTGESLPVERYLPPEEFEQLEDLARSIGFRAVASAPLVRSSYHASDLAAARRPD